jgi:hypothetical protein
MVKNIFLSLAAGTAAMFLVTVCAEESEQSTQAQAMEASNAMQYIMVYDLSLGKNEEKLHKKLNGRTPEQIIAKMKR